jgi:hypothetical protein
MKSPRISKEDAKCNEVDPPPPDPPSPGFGVVVVVVGIEVDPPPPDPPSPGFGVVVFVVVVVVGIVSSLFASPTVTKIASKSAMPSSAPINSTCPIYNYQNHS